ncbi:hypothetical protein CSPX01_09122, partial [Colletotrichum filicis]
LVPPTALARAPHLSVLSLSHSHSHSPLLAPLPPPPPPSAAWVGDHLLLLNPDPVRPPPFHLRKTLLGLPHTPFSVSCRVVVRSLEIASSTSNHNSEYPQPPPYPLDPTSTLLCLPTRSPPESTSREKRATVPGELSLSRFTPETPRRKKTVSALCLATLQENNNTRKPVPWFLTAAFCLLPSLLPRFCDSSLHCLLILPPRQRRGNEKGKSLPRTLHFASCTTHLLCCWLSYSLSACVCLCLYHLSLTTVGRPVFSRVGNTTLHSPRCPRRLVLPPSNSSVVRQDRSCSICNGDTSLVVPLTSLLIFSDCAACAECRNGASCSPRLLTPIFPLSPA